MDIEDLEYVLEAERKAYQAGQKDERNKIGKELVHLGYFDSITDFLDEIGGIRMLHALSHKHEG